MIMIKLLLKKIHFEISRKISAITSHVMDTTTLVTMFDGSPKHDFSVLGAIQHDAAPHEALGGAASTI